MAGSNTAASTKACWVATAIEHGDCKRYGVARPSAVKGFAGTVIKQSTALGSRAAVELAALTYDAVAAKKRAAYTDEVNMLKKKLS